MPSCVLCQSTPREKKHVKLDKLVNSSQTLEEAIRQQISFADQLLSAPQSDLGTCTACFRTINSFYVLLEKVKQFEAFFLEIPEIKTEPEDILIPPEESITRIEEVIKVEPMEREFVEELPILEGVEIKSDDDFWAENSEDIPVPDDPDFEIRPKKKPQVKKPPKPVRYLRPAELTEEILASGQDSVMFDGREYKIPPPHMKFKETKKSKIVAEADARVKQFLAIKCELCGAEFPGFFRLAQHFRRLHPGTEAYLKCCGMKFHRRNLVIDHLERHDPSTVIKCPICQKIYTSNNCLKSHIRNQHSEKPTSLDKPKFICNVCGRIFTASKTLDSHLSSHEVDTERQFECYICKKTGFPNSYKVRSHLSTYHKFGKVRLSKCDICSKQLKTYSLSRHMKAVHSDKTVEKGQCDICNKWIKKSTMRNHRKKHFQPRITCDQCSRTFCNQESLREHVKFFHEQNAHVVTCEHCGKIFRRKLRLKEHIAAMHTRELLYKCHLPGCEFANRQLSGLNEHLKRMHPEYYKQQQLPEHLRDKTDVSEKTDE